MEARIQCNKAAMVQCFRSIYLLSGVYYFASKRSKDQHSAQYPEHAEAILRFVNKHINHLPAPSLITSGATTNKDRESILMIILSTPDLKDIHRHFIKDFLQHNECNWTPR